MSLSGCDRTNSTHLRSTQLCKRQQKVSSISEAARRSRQFNERWMHDAAIVSVFPGESHGDLLRNLVSCISPVQHISRDSYVSTRRVICVSSVSVQAEPRAVESKSWQHRHIPASGESHLRSFLPQIDGTRGSKALSTQVLTFSRRIPSAPAPS